MVALADAWQKGAQLWDLDTRTAFATDFLNLLAVDGPQNSAKRDGDTATWLPPNKAFRCTYVARQVAVKHTYELWVTQAEQDAMVRVLTDCPDEPLPTRESAAAPTPAPSTDGTPPDRFPTAVAESSPDPDGHEDTGSGGSGDDGGSEVTYANCAEVREAGKDPIREGDPGYGPHLDRDGDGIGCE